MSRRTDRGSYRDMRVCAREALETFQTASVLNLSVERLRLPGSREGADLTLEWHSVIGAGFALPRDAGRRPALHVPALLLGWRYAVSRPLAAVPA